MKTLDEQIAAVKRELAARKKNYPREVSNQKMRQNEADHEIAAMESVLQTLTALK